MRAYDAVLCDIDGVLRHWPPPAELDAAHGLPAGTFASVAFAPTRLVPAITGEITDEQWRAEITVDLATHCAPEVAQQLVAAWSVMVPAVDMIAVDLVKRVGGSVRVALVTNATTRLEADLAVLGLDTVADTVVNSCRVGVAKPDPAIYEIAAKAVGAPPQRCVFIDDTHAHVVAARQAGMAAYHYRTLADLHDALASFS